MLRFLGNLPFWMRDRVRRPGAFRRLLARSKTKGDGHRATEIRDWERDASQVVMNDVAGNVAALSPKHRETVVAHLRALHAYQPQSYSGRVTLFRAQARSLRRAYDPELGWGRLAEGGVEVQLIPGDHYDLLECPYVEVLADKLALALSG
jgi:thioesterase domain-containing protein